MSKLKITAVALILGIIVTLATGALNSTPIGLVGASWYGYPLTWIRKLVIAPQYNPWRIDYVGIVADVVFWSVIMLALLLVLLRIGEKKAVRRKSPASGKRKS
ncbi:MAG: hypothetical protein KGI06_01660 [Candidatus Micrarchaeota archaeon]|nr:hypothetical protein [Candidatus Micrarchaeota archaeon]